MWQRKWFVLRTNFCLYAYRAPDDVIATASIPLISYAVAEATPLDGLDREFCFKLEHTGTKTLCFSADTKEEGDRSVDFFWCCCFSRALLTGSRIPGGST